MSSLHEKKAFFFEKKKQKTFDYIGSGFSGVIRQTEQNPLSFGLLRGDHALACIPNAPCNPEPRLREAKTCKSFLVLFFKKELACLQFVLVTETRYQSVCVRGL
jgi:hypothetical protein